MSRIRTNIITNRMANGAPTVSNGLVVSGVTTTTNLNVTSDVIVGGGLTVGGVLTYEDVTNIDSVGMITARTDITLGDSIIHLGDTNTKMRFPSDDNISFDTAGSERVRINAGGSIGIGTDDPQQDVHILRSQLSRVRIESTSTAYNSDVIFQNPDGLLGVVGYNATLDTINIDSRGGTDGITFTRTGVEKVRITSTGAVGIGTTNPEYQTTIAADGANAKLNIKRKTEASSNNNAYGSLFYTNNLGTDLASIRAQRESANTNAFLSFSTHNGTSLGERLRIDSSGRVLIGTTTEGHDAGDNLTVADTGNAGITIRSGSSNNGVVYFSDGTSGSAEYRGAVQYNHTDNYLRFYTNGSERLRIASAGQIGLSGASYGTAGQVLASGGSSAAPSWSGGAQRILEVVASPCDGSTIATSNGNITFPNVTAPQDLTTSYANVNGSIITYQPPSGTQQVIYQLHMQVVNHDDAIAIGHFKFYIDGSEVIYARRNASAEDLDHFVCFKYVINIGGSANSNTGRIASWSNAKQMKMTAREYNATTQAVSLHETDHWDGAGGNMFSQPLLHITAIGV